MHPLLYQSGSVTVTGYGLMLVLAFAAGVVLARARARKAGVEPRRIIDLCRLLILAAIVGSRLLHVAEHPSLYASDPWRVLRIWEGGLSMYGGVIPAMAAAALYARLTKESRRGVARCLRSRRPHRRR